MAALHAACFTIPRPWSALEISTILDSNHTFLLTTPNAFLIGRAVAGEAELLTLGVAPDARRQGNARRLVTQFLHESLARDATDAFLEVASDNAAAFALYAATGFAQTAVRRAYYARNIDALIMTQRLTPRPLPDF